MLWRRGNLGETKGNGEIRCTELFIPCKYLTCDIVHIGIGVKCWTSRGKCRTLRCSVAASGVRPGPFSALPRVLVPDACPIGIIFFVSLLYYYWKRSKSCDDVKIVSLVSEIPNVLVQRLLFLVLLLLGMSYCFLLWMSLILMETAQSNYLSWFRQSYPLLRCRLEYCYCGCSYPQWKV